MFGAKPSVSFQRNVSLLQCLHSFVDLLRATPTQTTQVSPHTALRIPILFLRHVQQHSRGAAVHTVRNTHTLDGRHTHVGQQLECCAVLSVVRWGRSEPTNCL
ncbi:unnamed protein product [Ectocarpus fasciculatus]